MLTETISQAFVNTALKLSACSNHEAYARWIFAAGWAAVAWYAVVALVCLIGCVSIQRNYSRIPQKSISATTLPPALVPHVTVIRPIKGLEPYLYENLAASLRQEYPRDKLTVCFCVSSRDDPAFPVIQKVLADFPEADTRLYVEPEYPNHELGPNPKIRNMSRAYYEAKGDLIWIVDCNVWLSKGVCGRMVDSLCGLGPGGQKYKFVHHLPLVVDVDDEPQYPTKDEEEAIPSCSRINYAANVESGANKLQRQLQERLQQPGTLIDHPPPEERATTVSGILAKGGGRLEELFLSSAHAKMYSAINTVLIAPCIVGKSSMFRRSHLDYLTAPSKSDSRPYPRRPGVDFFSDNICEDHMIGDRLWKRKIFEEVEYGQKWGKHHLVAGDLAIQPTSGMSVSSYIHRRVRWLRVRKFTVLLATLVEPGTEALLCSLYLAFGLTTSLPHYLYGKDYCSHFLASWTAFALIWITSIFLWINVDWYLYRKLHSATTIEVDEHTPPFARLLNPGTTSRRPFREWFLAWIGRESLAFPIWAWSFYGGRTIMWKDRAFKVGIDGVAREVGKNTNNPEQHNPSSGDNNLKNGVNTNDGDGYYQIRDSTRRPRVYVNNNHSEGSMDIRRRTPTGSVGKRGPEPTHSDA